MPSFANKSNAFLTVSRDAPYSVNNSCSEGSCCPYVYSPSCIRCLSCSYIVMNFVLPFVSPLHQPIYFLLNINHYCTKWRYFTIFYCTALNYRRPSLLRSSGNFIVSFEKLATTSHVWLS